MSPADYVEQGYRAMARLRTFYLSDCPHDGWQRSAWQEGAWQWMCEQRRAKALS